MTYKPVPLAGKWGLDCDGPLSAGFLVQLIAIDLHDYWPDVCPVGTHVDFFERYLPLPGNAIGGDITPRERDAIAATGKALVLAQHVRGDIGSTPGWAASATQGDEDALYALQYADQLGYLYASDDIRTRPGIVQDIENVKAGTDSYGSARSFRARIESAGNARHVVYEGFNVGMTDEQLADIGALLYADFGPRKPPPGRAFAIKQHPQKQILGVYFDLDYAMFDAQGDQLYGMADAA